MKRLFGLALSFLILQTAFICLQQSDRASAKSYHPASTSLNSSTTILLQDAASRQRPYYSVFAKQATPVGEPIETTKHISWWWWIVGVIVVIAAGMILYVLMKKNPKKDVR